MPESVYLHRLIRDSNIHLSHFTYQLRAESSSDWLISHLPVAVFYY